MKILQFGKVPERSVFHGECPLCHTIVEVGSSETQWRTETRAAGRYVDCPLENCFGTIDLTEGRYTGDDIKLPLRMAPETIIVEVDPTVIVSIPDDNTNKVCF